MTKKDYEAIAAVLKERRVLRPVVVDAIAYDMAKLFAEDNPRFNRNRFLTACGVAR